MAHAHHAAAPTHAAFSLSGLHCTGCADAVERTLKANPHITSVHIDWPASVAQVA
jgi:copper chaperone CopZ